MVRLPIAFAVVVMTVFAGFTANGQDARTSAKIRILGEEDVHRYRAIFEDERNGHFAEARDEIAKLDDTSLMGYALAEHILSPHSGRTKLADLNDWLDKYGDLSIADRIFKLANRRARRLDADVSDIPSFHRVGGGYEDSDLPDQPLSSNAARAVQAQIAADIHNGQPDAAAAIVHDLEASGNAPDTDIARLMQRVAASYLAEGMDAQGYDAASHVQGRYAAPLLDWYSGLAAYRLKNYSDAATHFETLAQVGSVPSWTRGAAAFWAARAHMMAGEPLHVVTLLQAAAREQPTFYGMLAEKMLGLDTQTGFTDPVLDADGFAALMQVPALHRAAALWQLGRTSDVPNEMNRGLAAIDLKLGPQYAALARKMDLPNLELRASETAASRGVLLTGLYPVPHYSPEEGYIVDPSLVFAFARIESRFQNNVTSPAGARGLMQIMPTTAAHIVGGRAGDLSDANYNLALGQKYIAELLGEMNGNLFELGAAYNAGPGAVMRWLGRPGMGDDPLLFVESMSSPQTRNYVKRLMMYHWMYERRLGRATPSLDETAAGVWPLYHPGRAAASDIPDAVRSFDAPATN